MDGASLSIGDFSRATHMSVKMLRHYHQIGLLEPAEIDRDTGYRRYRADQIPSAQVIRRFRDLDMPLERIQAVLRADDLEMRNELISGHLETLQAELAETQAAVASLQSLLGTSTEEGSVVGRRSVEPTPAAAIHQTIDMAEASSWYQGALGELHAVLSAQGLDETGSPGGIFSDDLFSHERGEATIFVPYRGELRETGRVATVVVPRAELVTVVHEGSDKGIDRAYGALGAHVATHALAVDGPIREYYLVSRFDTPDESEWRTEIGWPVFHTRP